MRVKDRKVIEQSLYDLDRFFEWIRSDEIQVHRKGFEGAIEKRCGSPLQYAENAFDKLKRLHAEQFK